MKKRRTKSINEWLNQLAPLPKRKLMAIVKDENSVASKLVAARLLLHTCGCKE